MTIQYEWLTSPHPDYTLKIYSTQLNRAITKTSGLASNMQYTDGNTPSEFSASTYAGMHTDCSRYTATPTDTTTDTKTPGYDVDLTLKAEVQAVLDSKDAAKARDTVITNISDLFNNVENIDQFFWFIAYNPTALFKWW